jgi:hypothetical protein
MTSIAATKEHGTAPTPAPRWRSYIHIYEHGRSVGALCKAGKHLEFHGAKEAVVLVIEALLQRGAAHELEGFMSKHATRAHSDERTQR